MSEVITTLNKKGDRSVEVYPNIKEVNIPTGAISTGKLADGAVTTGKLADSSVTTAKINDGAVTAFKLASNSINNNKLQDACVNTAKLEDASITTDKLANDSVTKLKIADYSIDGNKLDSDAVHTVNVIDECITKDKLSAGGEWGDNINIMKYLHSVEVTPRMSLSAYGISDIKFNLLIKKVTSATNYNFNSIVDNGWLDYAILRYGYLVTTSNENKLILNISYDPVDDEIDFTLFDYTNGVTTLSVDYSNLYVRLNTSVTSANKNI